MLQANVLLGKLFQDILDVCSSLRIVINVLKHIKYLVSSENESVSVKMFGSKVVIIIFGPRKQKVTRIYASRFVIYTQRSTERTEKQTIYFYCFPPSLKMCYFEGFRKPGPKELKFLQLFIFYFSYF
jgi:hypothetical protein